MNKQVLTSILEAFPKQRVLVLGDVMLDEYLYGEARRISPEAPVPVVEFQFRADSLGGAANVAANVADLGGQVLVGGLVGNDEPAQRLRDVLRCRRIDGAGLVVDSDRPTTLKTRVLGPCQQIVRIDRERRDRIGPAQENRLLAWVEESLPSVDACVLSDYGKGVVSERLGHGLIRMARQAGKPVVVDPKGVDATRYRGATLVKPNLAEAGQFVGRPIADVADLQESGQRLVELLGETAVLITRGPQGMSLFRSRADALHIAAVARNVFDVTGAGDTVIATLAMALAAGARLEEAVELANRAAGIAVGKRGTATVLPEELWTAC